LNFASKLEETKREVDECHRELVRLKATAFGSSQSDFNRMKQVVNEVKRKQRHQRQVFVCNRIAFGIQLAIYTHNICRLYIDKRSKKKNQCSATAQCRHDVLTIYLPILWT
jgi:hypothetical protein